MSVDHHMQPKAQVNVNVWWNPNGPHVVLLEKIVISLGRFLKLEIN
jgi:hypothetical protein